MPVTVAALTTSGMSTHAVRSSSGAMVPWQNTCTYASVVQPSALRSTTVVKPRMTPLSSMRSTRRLTAGADRFTRCADLGERRPGMLGELGENALVGLVQTVHDHSYAINRRISYL